MRISVSNIAWDPSEDAEVAVLLNNRRIDAIDVAHSKYFPEPAEATAAQVLAVKETWLARGIEIVGMQALLFGTQGLNVFGEAAVRQALLQHLEQVARIGAGLGAKWLVFGSPKNRDASGLAPEQVHDVAVDFFGKLGRIGAAEGVGFCLEPNPAEYGCNFMVSTDEAAQVVAAVNQATIRLQLDSGAMAMNGERPADVVARHSALVGHIHVSEPRLAPVGDAGADHEALAAALRASRPDGLVTIEMLATKDEPHGASIARACDHTIHHYRRPAELR